MRISAAENRIEAHFGREPRKPWLQEEAQTGWSIRRQSPAQHRPGSAEQELSVLSALRPGGACTAIRGEMRRDARAAAQSRNRANVHGGQKPDLYFSEKLTIRFLLTIRPGKIGKSAKVPMFFRPKDNKAQLDGHIRELERIPGVRVTRRAAIFYGATGLVAVLSGCAVNSAATNESDDDDDDDDTKPDSSDSSESDASDASQESSEEDESTSEDSETQTPDDSSSNGDDESESSSEEAESSTQDTGETTSEESSEGTSDDTSDDTTTDSSPLSLQELLDMVHPDAEKLIAESNPDDIAFLQQVVKTMQRLEDEFVAHPTQKYNIAHLVGRSPVDILQIDMAPNASIPLHDHADYIGALLGLKGSAECINYTVVEGDVEPGYFLLDETARVSLEPGTTGYLGLKEHNFHVVTAGASGAQMVDLFVFFDPNGSSNWASIVEVVDESKKRYKAKWGSYAGNQTDARVLLGRR
jgi:hypothetical protein